MGHEACCEAIRKERVRTSKSDRRSTSKAILRAIAQSPRPDPILDGLRRRSQKACFSEHLLGRDLYRFLNHFSKKHNHIDPRQASTRECSRRRSSHAHSGLRKVQAAWLRSAKHRGSSAQKLMTLEKVPSSLDPRHSIVLCEVQAAWLRSAKHRGSSTQKLKTLEKVPLPVEP